MGILVKKRVLIIMDVIKSFNDDIKNIFKSKDVNLDNWSFKLFYRVTYGLLILASVLVFATQYIGDPIECAFPDNGNLLNKVFEKKCWIHGAEKLAGPGNNTPDKVYQKRYDCLIKEGTEHHTTVFYQWVVFVLLIKAAVFRIPHVLWKMFEGGFMKSFYSGGEVKNLENWMKNKEDELVTSKAKFLSKLTSPKSNMNSYYFIFVVCEFLNLVVLGIVWKVTDKFINGNFNTYGSDFYNEMMYGVDEVGYNTMCNAFPTMTRCTYYLQGNDGGDKTESAQCVLAQNIINQKIYLVLWYWLVFLMIVGGLQIIFELAIFAVPSFRNALLTWNIGDFNTIDVRNFLHSKGVADWFVFYQVSKNTDKQFFCLLLENMSRPAKSSEQNDLKGNIPDTVMPANVDTLPPKQKSKTRRDQAKYWLCDCAPCVSCTSDFLGHNQSDDKQELHNKDHSESYLKIYGISK